MSLGGRRRKWIGALVVATIASASACHLPAPKPVVIYVPATVTIDTLSHHRVGRMVSGAKTFWQAMASLDTEYVTKHTVTDDERAFSRAMSLVMIGHQDDAELALDSISSTTKDSLISATSRVLLTAMLQYQDKWKILAELTQDAKRDTSSAAEINKADVERWAAAFKGVNSRSMTFPAKPVVVPLLISASGTPMITVMVNGKPKIMWLDTGSSMSIVSSDVATDCGITPLVPDTLEVATTTGHVPARPATIARLQIGGIDITNSTAMIVATDMMEVKVGDGSHPEMQIPIEGVIGFDIISRLDLRIDYVHHRVTMAKPQLQHGRAALANRNLFWVGTPIVRLVSDKGVTLHFNLDTGAQETYSTETLIDKTKMKTVIGERRLVGGLAGYQVVHGRFIDEIGLSMAGQRLLFQKVLVYAPAVATLIPLDGVLGSDIGRSGIVRIDATNGIFLLQREDEFGNLKYKS